MQAIAFYIFYPIIWIISRFPPRMAYMLSDLVFLLLFYVIKYRKDVIVSNLKTAFPDKSEAEIHSLHKASTKHFCDSFIEVILSMGLSHDEMRKRFVFKNITVARSLYDQKKPVIILFGHQASYEWTMCIDGQSNYKVVAVYKPLANKYFNDLIVNIRKKFNSTLIPSHKATKAIATSIENGELALYGLVADQAPARYRATHFTTFFNKPSAVFTGGERLARKHNTAVLFLAVEKVKRGFYEATFHTITENASETDEWEITDQFFDLLEQQIRKQPEYYLWSHKRWKVTPENAKRAVVLSPRVQQ